MLDILSTIEKLCEYPSPSGFEHSASKRVENIMSRVMDKVEHDAFGNVYGIKKCGKKGAKCILLDAHIDEIGLMVTGTKNGFLTFTTLGGVDPRILPATEVLVLTNPPRFGVITALPPHLQSEKEMENAFDIENLCIDIGAEKDEKTVPCGTPVIFSSGCVKLCENYISARALDDRGGLVAILTAIDMLKSKKLSCDVVVLASVQEEVGCRGAKIAGFSVNPDLAIAVDVTHAHTPGADKTSTFKSGSGVAIGVGPNMTKKISDALIFVAKDKKIPHTIEVCAGHSGTNAWVLQTAREGIATGLLSIPLKYMHTPVETVKKKDIEATAKLICEFLLNLSSGGIKL